MASQESIVSTISVPPEILENQDTDFADEINNVDILYFANVANFEQPKQTDQETESDSDSEESSWSQVVSGGQSERIEDENEASAQYDFQINWCGCGKIYGHPCFKE